MHDCHAWSCYWESGATKVSLTRTWDRDGGELSNISPRRYFCMQCHVPQTDAKPLVRQQVPARGRPAALKPSINGIVATDNNKSLMQRIRGAGLGAPSCCSSPGVVFWGGFNWALEMTNTEKFCISCHEMEENVFKEYRNTIHYQNRTGVRPDPGPPCAEGVGPKMIRKGQGLARALRQVMGTIAHRRSSPPSACGRAERVEPHEGEQLAGVPQLLQLRVFRLLGAGPSLQPDAPGRLR